MAISDLLEKIGSGVEKAGKVAGAVAAPIGKAVAEEEAGYAPEIASEKRHHAQQLEDAQLGAKEAELTSQLEMGRKYGTLTPEQQSQYVDAITQLYSHPRHAPKLMEKLRKIVHPEGAVAGPAPKLASATPEGGTAAADAALKSQNLRPLPGVKPFKGPDGTWLQPMINAQGQVTNEEVPDYVPPAQKAGAGKSPPLSGDKLPTDAVGPNGEPIPTGERTAGKSFIQFHDEWWPVAAPKPLFKKVQDHLVLIDPESHNIIKDYGPESGAKVTTRQTLQPGDDKQMHMVNLTSITTPQGATIDVQPEQSETKEGAASAPKATASASSVKPKTSVGSLLKPTTNAAPAAKVAGPVVPGFKMLAASKNPLFKSDLTQYTKLAEDANNKQEAFVMAQKAMAAPTPSSDQELIFSWVRANVQGAGRMTQAEFRQAAQIGSLPLKAQNWWSLATSGKLTPDLRNMMFADIQRAAQTAQEEANRLRPNPTGAPTGGAAKKHSLKKAMSLPFNKGKSEAQVRADLESHGYEVIP